MNNKKVILIFIFLIGFQMLFSFLFPSYNDIPYWSKILSLDSDSRYSLDSFDNSIAKRIYPFIKNYRLNLDGAGYLLAAHNFPQHYFAGNLTLLTRPLYPILVNIASRPLHLISNSYSMTFVAGILVNLILFFLTVYLFYLLVRKLISFRVAFLSSILLIFSPLAHVWLIQPETNIFGIFAVITSLYLLYDYLGRPSLRKLILFSLAVGFLLLGKKLFALSIFILILAVLFKRYKEGLIFLVAHLLPLLFYSVWVKQVWGLNVYVDEVSHWGFAVWLLNIFRWPWYQTLQIFIESVPKFISAVIYGFLLIPVIFATIGYKRLVLPQKNIILFSFFFSFFVLFFGMNIYLSRFGFWMFPVVYPLAVLGIDEAAGFLKKYKNWYSPAFYILAYGSIIAISSLNIYKFVIYG